MSKPIHCDVPEMDLGNHKSKLFGLTYRQLVLFVSAAIILYIVISKSWGTKSISEYMPIIIIVLLPAWYFSSKYPYGLRPERFLLVWVRYNLLTRNKRPYMSEKQRTAKKSIGERIDDYKEASVLKAQRHAEERLESLDRANETNNIRGLKKKEPSPEVLTEKEAAPKEMEKGLERKEPVQRKNSSSLFKK